MWASWFKIVVLTAVMGASEFSFAEAVPGSKAPNFSLTDAAGNLHQLSDYKESYLVLEWFNKDCPYVKKHYGSNNMQNLQAQYLSKGVNWLTIISSAEGKQGYLSQEQALAQAKLHGLASSAAFLLDSKGDVGRAYGAKTTPHMFIIDPKGIVVYAGAIDDNDSANPAHIATSRNYVSAALDALLAGQPVSIKASRPYGCSIKY